MFNDEFEMTASDGKTYYIEVDGAKFSENGQVFTEINQITVHDESGMLFDEDNDIMREISEEAFDRDYEVEVHSRDMDYYSGIAEDEDFTF